MKLSRKEPPSILTHCRIRFKDPETGKTLVFLNNHFQLPALTICALYKNRWQVELFFKWIKQHLRIKRFLGTSENAVKSQIRIAVSVYVLIAIIKERLNLDLSLHTFLQILSVTIFEKIELTQIVADSTSNQNQATLDKHANTEIATPVDGSISLGTILVVFYKMALNRSPFACFSKYRPVTARSWEPTGVLF